ncbi:MAG: hypothetical protein H6573_32610 [Lewinellaceae bacterium]|nr:hypothetical protein [Phaeodactylibacter sp.]MCB9352203.1 hypothetical protein [Lewinellaceae bacterium]
MSIAIGQTVQVKPGQQDEDTGTSLAGWSGRVVAMHSEYNMVEVEWDSTTLLHIPDAYLRHCIDGGYDYLQYNIGSVNLAIIEPQYTLEQVREIQKELEARYHDYQLYGGPPIPFSAVEREAFTTELLLPQSYVGWLEYMEKHLVFPFQAKVVEGYGHIGKKLEILALDDYDDPHGVIAVIKWVDGGAGHFLLCDLEATDKGSSNYRILREYVVWFANQ